MKGFFSRVGSVALKTLGSLSAPLKTIGQVGYNVGRFTLQNHATLAPLLHSVAMASGNQTAAKITGGLMALSQTASMRQKLNADNQKVASAMGKGGYGVYNHSTGGFT